MQKFLIFLYAIYLASCSPLSKKHDEINEKTYPGYQWSYVKNLKLAGWNQVNVKKAKEFFESLDSSALFVSHKGRVVIDWGQTRRRFKIHSIRKSLLSSLYGIYIDKGKIKKNWTLKQLSIDDKTNLTEIEKSATIENLLKSRSCVYIPSNSETPKMKEHKPKRHSCVPGEGWYYNNFDFNALGTIFKDKVGEIFSVFNEDIAKPLSMEDFRQKDGKYKYQMYSNHPAYHFYMSSRDLARFGLLYLRDGKWSDRQIIPKKWISESLVPYSPAGNKGAYGYMWWVAKNGVHLPGVISNNKTFSARGYRGHYIYIDKKRDLVIVHRVNTFKKGTRVNARDFGTLVSYIYDSMR